MGPPGTCAVYFFDHVTRLLPTGRLHSTELLVNVGHIDSLRESDVDCLGRLTTQAIKQTFTSWCKQDIELFCLQSKQSERERSRLFT